MAEVCEEITLTSGDKVPSLALVEETFANALVEGAWLAVTVGDPKVNVQMQVKTPLDLASGVIELCYDDADLPAGVTRIEGNVDCLRDCWPPAEPDTIWAITNDGNGNFTAVSPDG